MSYTDIRAVILAGGASRRMGENKALLRLADNGPTLIELVVSALHEAGLGDPLIVTNTPEPYAFLGLATVPDEAPGAGPLVGILSGLLHSGAERILVVGCDMPLLKPGLLRFLASLSIEADAVIPSWTASSGKVQVETLHAIYSTACVEPIRRRLAAGDFRAHALMEDVRVLYIEEKVWREYDPQLESFRNVNTPDDLRSLRHGQDGGAGDQAP